MENNIIYLFLLTCLVPTIMTKEAQFQDQNNLSKEDRSDNSKPKNDVIDRKTSDYNSINHGNFPNEDSRSSEKGEQKTKRSRINKIDIKLSNLEETSDQNKKIISKDLTSRKKQKTVHQSLDLDADSLSSHLGETSEHSGRNKNLDDDRPNQTEQKNLEEYGTNKNDDEQKNGHYKNLNKDKQKDRRQSQSHKQTIHEQNNKNQDLVDEENKPSLYEQKTSINDNLSKVTTPSLDKKTTVHHRHLNVNRKPGHGEHITMMADNDFAYMVAVLKGTTYVCAGALIDESWVLTAADSIHLLRETIRFLRIRLGSINYKKGGTLLPVKYLEIHPYFNSSKPSYDLALIMLSKPVRFTANMRSIRLQLTPREVTSTHFIMTSWPGVVKSEINSSQSTEVIKHHRILSVTHLHPSDPEECVEELRGIGAAYDEIMCLESGMKDSCMRDTGAPIVINGVLWGIISSWKPEDCEEDYSVFATLVSARNISTWIHATVHGHRWHSKNK